MGRTRDLFKKIRYQGNISPKVGSIKDRNGMDLAEAEEVARIHRRYTEELTKKIFMTQIITMV